MERNKARRTLFLRLLAVQAFSAMQKGGIEAYLSPDIIELIFAQFGMSQGYEKYWHFVNSVVSILPLFGQFVGSLLLPLFKAKLGYKKASLVSLGCFIGVQGLNMVPLNIWLTIFLSFAAGIFAAVNAPLVLLWVGELAEKTQRGLLGVFYEIFVGVGNMLCSAALLCVNYYFRVAARRINMYYLTFLPGVLESVFCAVCEIGVPDQRVAHDHSSEITYKQTFSRRYARPLFIAILIGIWQQASGIYAITQFATEIFATYFDTPLSSALGQLIVNAGKTLPTIPVLFLVETQGRRKHVLWGSVGCVVGLLTVVVCYAGYNLSQALYDALLMSGHVIFLIGYSMAPGPFCFVLGSEIYPKAGKGKFSGIQMVFFYICSMSVVGLFEITSAAARWLPYLCYSVCIACSTLGLLLLVPETKNKTQEEIERLVMGRYADDAGDDLVAAGFY